MMLRHFFVLGTIVIFAFISCVLEAKRPIKIVTSFSIIGDIAKNICGPHGEVVSLVGPNSDAHVFEPSAKDMVTLLKADVVFVNGFAFESWLDRLIQALSTSPNQINHVVICTESIKPLPSRQAPLIPDPHAWNHIGNAKTYVLNILKGLKKADPENAETYEKNAKIYLQRLLALEKEIHSLLDQLPKNNYVLLSWHDAFQYLGKDLGVVFRAPVGVDTNTEPSAKAIAQMITDIREKKIHGIFIENITNPKMMQRISEETQLPIGDTLYSDALSLPEEPASTYEKLLRHNYFAIFNVLSVKKP